MKSREEIEEYIEELKNDCKYRHTDFFDIDRGIKTSKIKALEWVLSD